jgi:Protein of unknown function (DUF2934)
MAKRMKRSTAVSDDVAMPEIGSAGNTPMKSSSRTPTHEQIAREAYAIYLANGARDGHDQDDWFTAERLLRSESGDERMTSRARREQGREQEFVHADSALRDVE